MEKNDISPTVYTTRRGDVCHMSNAPSTKVKAEHGESKLTETAQVQTKAPWFKILCNILLFMNNAPSNGSEINLNNVVVT